MSDRGADTRDTPGIPAPGSATLDFVVCDVFTDTPLQGNQLGVFTNAKDLTAGQMQKLARELNYSETTFVLPPEQGGDARIRIFTPTHEIPFAGHPTLGTAVVLGGQRSLKEVVIETKQGLVPVQLEPKNGRVSFGRMLQPLPTVSPFERAADLLAGLGVERSELPVEMYDNGLHHVYVSLGSEEQVARLEPDHRALIPLGEINVSCFAGSGQRWKTRMFAPAEGVPEDPATGSAAGPLAYHLARHGLIGWGQEIEIRQGAEVGRPSKLYARVDGSADGVERVEVGGSAVIVARGEFVL